MAADRVGGDATEQEHDHRRRARGDALAVLGHVGLQALDAGRRLGRVAGAGGRAATRATRAAEPPDRDGTSLQSKPMCSAALAIDSWRSHANTTIGAIER